MKNQIWKEIFSYVLAAIVFIGYFALLGKLWTSEIPTGNRDIALTMLGSFMTICIMIAKHLYDGNKQSSVRDEMLYRSNPSESSPAPGSSSESTIETTIKTDNPPEKT